jgi:tetratricopeptide (TPR) repeat protein
MLEPPSSSDVETDFVDGLARFTIERDLAEYLIEQLGAASLAKLKKAVRRLAAEQPWPVTAALLKLARFAAELNPSREILLARLALTVAPGVRLPENAKSALLFEALVRVGDGLRRQHKFMQAEHAFSQAARHLAKAGDPQPSALYCTLLAHLREDQGRHEESLALRSRAAALYQELGQIDD